MIRRVSDRYVRQKMNRNVILSMFGGICAGSAMTLFLSHAFSQKVAIVNDSHEQSLEDSSALDWDSSEVEEPEELELDLTSVTDRDLWVSLWYWDMTQLVDRIEDETGHVFQKKVGKMYASPSEILREQAVFMDDFQNETETIAKAGRQPNRTKKKAEQAVPPKSDRAGG